MTLMQLGTSLYGLLLGLYTLIAYGLSVAM